MYFLWYSWTETCVFLLRCSINGLTSKLLRLPIFMYIIIANVSAFSCLKNHKCRRSRETRLPFILVSAALLFIWVKTCVTFVEVMVFWQEKFVSPLWWRFIQDTCGFIVFLNWTFFQVFECLVEQKLVEVCFSAGKVRLSSFG